MKNETIIIETESKDYSKQSFWKRNGINLIYSVTIALIIIFICTLFDKSFFFYDDAQISYLPYLRSVGRIWLKREIPFIIKNTFIGQNMMIDIDRGLFLPQNIIMSMLSVKISSLLTISKLIAFINLTLMSFFAQKIAEALDIKNKIVMAFLFSINPVLLYFYLASWWNSAAGQVWFVAALASIFLLRKSFKIRYLIFNIFSVLCVLASGWPHSAISYMFVMSVYLIELFYNKEYKKIKILILISLGIILIGFNIYSEYIISSKIITRPNGFGNFENFLSPTFNQIFMTFTPVYYNFMNGFGGYKIIYIPIAYSSIYILYLICFSKKFSKLIKNKNLKYLLIMTLIFFVLSQSPSQFIQTRYPFRFLPYLSEFLIILGIYGISISKLEFSNVRIRVFISVILVSILLSFFSLEEKFIKILVLNLLFLLLTVVHLYVIIKKRKLNNYFSILYSVLMLFFMLSVQKSTDGILSFPITKEEINTENNFNKNEYLLALTNGSFERKNIEDLFSGQFLIYNIKAINGYSPVGNKDIVELLGFVKPSPHHIFNQESTVNALSNKYNNVCYFDLLNIGSIVIFKNQLNDDMKNKIQGCGYLTRNVRNPNAIYFVKDKSNTVGNVSYLSEGIEANKMLEDKANKEKYLISSTQNGYIIMSKVYWRGYRAYINGKKVNISDEKGLIKLDNIPKGLDKATLEIKYFPASWKYTLWLIPLGIIIILIGLRKSKNLLIEEGENIE